MDFEHQIEMDYIKGFNEGYILTQYAPDIAKSIASIGSTLPRIEGIKDGREQFIEDKFKELQNERQRPAPVRQQNVEQSRYKDIEPER